MCTEVPYTSSGEINHSRQSLDLATKIQSNRKKKQQVTAVGKGAYLAD